MQLCPTFTPNGKFCRPRHVDEEIPPFNPFFLRCRWALSLFLRYVVVAMSTFAQYDKSWPECWGLCFAKWI